MSNGTKPIGKDFKIKPKFPSVTVSFDGEKILVEYKNANWETAVNLLVDGLQMARFKENEAKKKNQSPIITAPGGLYIPRGS